MSRKRQKPEMARKEALAVIHKVFDAMSLHLYDANVSEETKVLREQIYDAFHVLDVAVHGEQLRHAHWRLCRYCYLRQRLPDLLVLVKGDCISKHCCQPCLEQLKAEEKIERMKLWSDKEMRWIDAEEKREVQA